MEVEFHKKFSSNGESSRRAEVRVSESVVECNALPDSEKDVVPHRGLFSTVKKIKENTGTEANEKGRSRLYGHVGYRGGIIGT